MMMSPLSKTSATCSTTCPVTEAGIITHAALGTVSFAANSSRVSAPVAPSASRALIDSGELSNTTHSCPARIRRRTMLAPIRPRPIIPSCATSATLPRHLRRRGTAVTLTLYGSIHEGAAGARRDVGHCDLLDPVRSYPRDDPAA